MGNKDKKINKKLKRSFFIFLIVGLITLFIILCKGKIFGFRLIPITDEQIKESHSIQVTAESNYITEIGDSVELKISIDGADVDSGYELSSSDEEVATIEGNTVVGKKLGSTIITAYDPKYENKSEIEIEVIEACTKIELSSQYRIITIGEDSTSSYVLYPKNAKTQANIEYSSSDESVATVKSDGVVTGVSAGKATITATDTITGNSDSFVITVK